MNDKKNLKNSNRSKLNKLKSEEILITPVIQKFITDIATSKHALEFDPNKFSDYKVHDINLRISTYLNCKTEEEKIMCSFLTWVRIFSFTFEVNDVPNTWLQKTNFSRAEFLLTLMLRPDILSTDYTTVMSLRNIVIKFFNDNKIFFTEYHNIMYYLTEYFIPDRVKLHMNQTFRYLNDADRIFIASRNNNSQDHEKNKANICSIASSILSKFHYLILDDYMKDSKIYHTPSLVKNVPFNDFSFFQLSNNMYSFITTYYIFQSFKREIKNNKKESTILAEKIKPINNKDSTDLTYALDQLKNLNK